MAPPTDLPSASPQTACNGLAAPRTTLAFDPVQRLLAIGMTTGDIKIFGQPSVELLLRGRCGASDTGVTHMAFVTNRGRLVAAYADDELSAWNYADETGPAVECTLRFRDGITCLCVPPLPQAQWMFVGTARGNVHVVHIESFAMSGYEIMWNHVIPLSHHKHPGRVVAVAEHPAEDNKLLIAHEMGHIVLFDLPNRTVARAFGTPGDPRQMMRSISWCSADGSRFVVGHASGAVSVWRTNQPAKPESYLVEATEQALAPCTAVAWAAGLSAGDTTIAFTGGYPASECPNAVSVVRNRERRMVCFADTIVDLLTVAAPAWLANRTAVAAVRDPSHRARRAHARTRRRTATECLASSALLLVLMPHDFVAVDLKSTKSVCGARRCPYASLADGHPVCAAATHCSRCRTRWSYRLLPPLAFASLTAFRVSSCRHCAGLRTSIRAVLPRVARSGLAVPLACAAGGTARWRRR